MTQLAPRISFESVEKRYGERTVLRNISFSVEPGTFMVLLGPSGSGKSTMLRCLAGLEKVDRGTIRLGNDVVSSKKVNLPPENRGLAMVFQDFALWPHMTVQENVTFALDREKLTKSKKENRVLEMLDRVGLAHLGRRYPNALSGGEQQRVALARALVGRPGLVLFDEPLSSLDADLRERLRIEISSLTRELGATVVYITHDQAEAFAAADLIAVLDKGELVQLGKPEEIYREPITPFVAQFTGLAGEIHGSVTSQLSNGNYLVTTNGGPVEARSHGHAEIGQAVKLLLRSAPIKLMHELNEAYDLRGKIVDVAFRGRGYDHVVDVDGCGHLLGIFSEFRWERETAVFVRVPAEAAMAFPTL